jgi:hypothetical protein
MDNDTGTLLYNEELSAVLSLGHEPLALITAGTLSPTHMPSLHPIHKNNPLWVTNIV